LDGTKGAAGAFGSHSPASFCKTTYGRYSIRFKVTGAGGYGTAMMLWPNSDTWSDGEIDYPEGDFDGTMQIFHHTMDPVKCADGCSETDYSFNTGVGFREWHTANTEWLPGKVSYYLDGNLLHTVTTSVPATGHRMTIQMAPTSAPATSGHFLIDWVAIYAPQ
jgi:beta-glucanase (GH16 family)